MPGIKSSKSFGDSHAHLNDLDRPSGDARVQSQALACHDQQSGGNGASTGRRQQALDIKGSTTALDRRQPLSASTFGKPLPSTPAVKGHKLAPVPAANRMLTHAASDVAKRNKSQAPQPVPPERATMHEPVVAESPGIITSATIARLASHSAAQQPLNGKPTTRLNAPPSRDRVPDTLPRAAAAKRKSTDLHQPQPDSSDQGGQSNPTPPSSRASSPTSSSPDQPAAGKRKKIKWDPQVALSQPATGAATAQAQQAQQPPPSDSLQPAASECAQTQQSAAAAPSTSISEQLPPSSSPVQPPNSIQMPTQTAAPAADKQVHKESPGEEEVERLVNGGAGQAGPEVDVVWSWGPGAAVQGRFDAALVSMMPGFVGAQKPGSKFILPTCLSGIALGCILHFIV